MSEKPTVSDAALGELALKFEAELPEELVRFLQFSQDKKAENLVIDWSVELPAEDVKLLTDVAVRFGGCYVNRRENGRDCGCFLVPKTPPKVAEKSPESSGKVASKSQTPQPSQSSQVSQSDNCNKVTNSQVVTKSQDTQTTLPPKNKSPFAVFLQDCLCCESQDKCRNDLDAQKTCMALKSLFAVQDVVCELRGLNENLSKVVAALQQGIAHGVSHGIAQHGAAQQPSASTPVQRSTRPTEGHSEGDIVWIWDENQQHERYEKALEKDNQRSNGYFELRKKLLDAQDAGKKGLVIGDKWCWLSKKGDFIGRKPAKQWPERRS